jgi:glycosyltransferase involved in cell wall biosynthesis
MKKVLYITRNGLLEPLGQSQILSYLVPLSKEFSISIISFEKAKDLENEKHLASIKSICDTNNIKWNPLTYRKTFRSLGIIIGMIELFFKALNLTKNQKVDFIHARSYYPAFIALLICRIKKTPFIFDMRALWPEELVEAGRLKDGGLPHKLIKFLEKKCLKKSFAVVSLTSAALEYLDKIHPDYKLKGKTSVIPTCANLERFQLKERKFAQDAITLSCIGSMLSGWFKIHILKDVVEYLLSNYSEVNFEFLTRDNQEELLLKIDPNNKWRERLHIEPVLFKDMPKRLSNHDGSMFFFTANISKLGSAPTRMAEILGTGIPVLTNAGVGDVDKIVSTYKVGELLKSEDIKDIKIASDNFMQLIKQKDISNRCRVTSEELFSLDVGVIKYRSIYSKIV